MALGGRDFESVTRSDVQRLYASLRNIPATANYVVNVIGSLYKRIITDWELSELRHPTHGVKLFKMRVRERFLSPEERQRVHEAMAAGLKIPAGRKGHLEPRSVWALQLLSLNDPARPTHRPPRGDRAGPPSLTVAEVVMRHEHAFAGGP